MYEQNVLYQPWVLFSPHTTTRNIRGVYDNTYAQQIDDVVIKAALPGLERPVTAEEFFPAIINMMMLQMMIPIIRRNISTVRATL